MSTEPEDLDIVSQKASSNRDFWIGFLGWWIFNIVAGGLNVALSVGLAGIFQNNDNLANLLGFLPTGLGCLVFLLNIGALIFFAFRWKQVALGILVAFGVAIAISILIGVIATVACFVILSGYGSGG